MSSPKSVARIAGLLYLIVAVCAMFAELFVRARIVESGDATATAANIRASASLFRIGFVADMVEATCFLLLAMVLYKLLKHVNQMVAAAMVTFVAVSVAIMCLNLLNQYTALTVATSDDYTRSFGKAGADGMTLLFTSMFSNGYIIATMFFGLWLGPLGYLVIKSGYFPKVLGILLVIACGGWILDFFTKFLAPGLGTPVVHFVSDPAGAAGELTFMAWLLVKGVRVPAPAQAEPAFAVPSSGGAPRGYEVTGQQSTSTKE